MITPAFTVGTGTLSQTHILTLLVCCGPIWHLWLNTRFTLVDRLSVDVSPGGCHCDWSAYDDNVLACNCRVSPCDREELALDRTAPPCDSIGSACDSLITACVSVASACDSST